MISGHSTSRRQNSTKYPSLGRSPSSAARTNWSSLSVALPGPLEVNTLRARRSLVVFAKAGDPRGSDALRVAGSQRVEKRPIVLVEEQDAINIIGLAEVGNQARPEGAHVGVERAKRASLPPFQVHLGDLLHARHVRTEHIFHRAEEFHAALLRLGQDGGHDVQLAVVRRAGLLEHRVAIELGVRGGVIAAVERALRPIPAPRGPGTDSP